LGRERLCDFLGAEKKEIPAKKGEISKWDWLVQRWRSILSSVTVWTGIFVAGVVVGMRYAPF
jgi:hypothetical protein